MDRRLDQRRRPGPGLRQVFPEGDAGRLRRYIAGVDKVLRRSTEKILIPAIARGNERSALRAMQRDVDQEYSDEDIEKEMAAIAAAVNLRHSRLFYASIGAALGVIARPIARKTQPPPPRASVVIVEQFGPLGVKEFVRDGTKLIKSVRDTAIPRIRREIETAKALNQDPAKLAKRWQKQGLPLNFGTVEGRSKVIARDQIGKLNGRLTELRQANAGIKSYIWRTQLDDSVRDEHADREGVEFQWSSPPSDGHPGEPIACRCNAEAVIRPEDIIASPNVIELEAEVRLAS
jgi:SPP1 gp7 family putative phage head morphogenesis protein